MNKVWFIFKGTHHLGPFSEEEVVKFYKNGEINQHTLIWKEGTEKWEPLKNQKVFNLPKENIQQQLQDLPSLPALDDIDDDEPPPIPLDAIIDPNGKVTIPRKPSIVEDEVEDILYRAKKKKDFSFYLWTVVGLIFTAIILQYFYQSNSSAKVLRIRGLMPSHLERLQSIAYSSSKDMEIAMALSLDGKSLWGSTNKENELKMMINLTSIEGRVMGSDEVKVMISGRMKNHVGEFNRMILKKGKSFYPGEYNLEVKAEETSFINRIYPKLETIKFFKSLNKKFNYKGTALIYSGPEREFEKKILEYKNQIINEKLRPYSEKLERIQTVLNLLITVSQNYQMTLEKIKRGSEIKEFEQKYIKEVSPLLQSLILRTYEITKDPKLNEENTVSAVAPYSVQLLLMKQLGELASDMVTKTAKLKKIKDKDRESLKSEFEKKANSIKLQLDLNIKKLEAEISKVSPSFR